MSQIRAGRLSNEIQKEIADIISNEVKDPRMGFVSVLRVESSRDLSSAKVYITSLSDEDKNVLAALEKAKGFIRRELGKRLRTRVVPELYFHLDNSISYGIKMSGIISKQIKEDEAAASSRPEEE